MKYIIKWDAGWGMSYEEVEADSKDQAEEMAQQFAQDEFEANVDYGVIGKSTKKLQDDYGLNYPA